MSMKNPQKIQKMFNEIAYKYDFMNNIISFGTHKSIKKLAINKLKLRQDTAAIDLCCGTGDITKLLALRSEVEKVIGMDFSDKMLELAKRKNSHPKIKYIKADCTNLPFEDNFFDLVTISFGLRNIEDTEKAIDEIKRVLKKDGQFVHLDFGTGNFLTNFIFEKSTLLAAQIFSKNPESYKYLINSKRIFFKPDELKKYMADKGFICHSEYNFLFSTINIQVFVK